MNTIPSIFNEKQIPRTVIGGSEIIPPADLRLPISVLLLNRGARHYRAQVFRHLLSFGFTSVVSLEQSGDNYDIENLAKNFPTIKFIVPEGQLTVGEMINAGISEITTDYVFVLWNDMVISQKSFPVKLVEQIMVQPALCVVPSLFTQKNQLLPVQMVPSSENGRFSVVPVAHFQDGSHTLYPFDFAGIYNRSKLIQLGGFDYTLKSPYWQNLDFFLRGWLWGEQTLISTACRLSYEDAVSEEDMTPDESYCRFFLKNILPQYYLDHAEILMKRYPQFLRCSPYGFFESFPVFLQAREWVAKNRYRFKTDIYQFIQSWEKERV